MNSKSERLSQLFSQILNLKKMEKIKLPNNIKELLELDIIKLTPSLETFEKQFKQIKHHRTLPVSIDVSHISEKYIEELSFESPTPDNTTKFEDIKWIKCYQFREDGLATDLEYRSLITYDNGYAVSIVNSISSEGNFDEYEIALIHKDDICWLHENDVPFDILGCLSKDEVSRRLEIVLKLKENK